MISVLAGQSPSGRNHMEDYIAVLPNNTASGGIPDQAYIGVFNGHGDKEAAKYIKEELWECIQNRIEFLSHDVSTVKESIREVYLELHEKMLKHRRT